MSKEQYQPNCPGCLPALMNLKTGEVMPMDSPEMKAIMAYWQTTTLAERQAWHEFTCQNSREPQILAVASRLAAGMTKAMATIKK